MPSLQARSKTANFICSQKGMGATEIWIISVQSKHKFGRRQQKKKKSQPKKPNQKKKKTQPQILYSFKWNFFFLPKLELFLNPIFPVLNILCLKQGKKKKQTQTSFMPNKFKLLPLYLHRPLNRSYVLYAAKGTARTRNCCIWITSSNIHSGLQTGISLPSCTLLIPW